MARKFGLSFVVAAICSLATVSATHADDLDDIGFEQGEFELQLSGSGTSDEDFDSNAISFDLGLNYFFVDQLSIGLDLQGSTSSTERDLNGDGDHNDNLEQDSSNSWGVGAALDYNIPLGRIQPFVGVTIGYLFGDAVDETAYAGPEAGLKIFITDDAYAYASAQYQFLFDDGDEFEENADDGRLWYGLGIGVTFGGED